MKTPTPEIRQCLEVRLVGLLPGLGLAKSDVAWTNMVFTPKTDRLYLRPTLMLNPTETRSLGPNGFEQIQGIFQVDVFGVLNTGPGATEEIARGLVDAFRGGTTLTCRGCEVRITKAYAGTARKDGERLHVPVSVVWYCYAQK